ncbi:tyrosine-type recombinase/integrase [Paenibacillus piri]|uniref:Tyr recombinase domain-containing protein n=1 Tax=Paenibacillus piri TaxID=2547395 RepID=A0A4R5KVY6_9BACL|nr:tyrosine-type recombinase/integrase [Paenibacillus piri]TDG00144.1 hypothetical protein E1757_00385 [Paenibacillus piri]
MQQPYHFPSKSAQQPRIRSKALSTKTIWNMMNTLKIQMQIHPKRNIVFHSFRNFAPNFIIDTEGDFKAAQLQSGHSDIKTLWNHYVSKQRDVTQSAGLLLDEKLDQDAFNKLTYDEMRQLLNDKKNGVRTQLIREASKLLKQR